MENINDYKNRFYNLMESYIGDVKPLLNEESGCKGNCENGYGVYTLTNGDVYKGYFKNGEYDGYGIYTNKNGDVTKGFWSNGLYDPNKSNEIGATAWRCIKGDCENGYGVKEEANVNFKSIYTGNFKNGKLEGYGTEVNTFPGNSTVIKYKGYFKNGRLNGYGEMTDGVVKFKGNYVDGKPFGYGVYKNKHGIEIKRDWKSGFNEFGNTYWDNLTTPPDETTTENPTTTHPEKPTHRYEGDTMYEYVKEGDNWWAQNIKTKKWFNLTELVKTKPKIQISLDRLNDGTKLIPL